ncbi:bifunctional phosphopantothenoylcysteine decarboxylase/phosphopantothenate--cysteine ligase CoaBC [bacterium]|nr:bifunctional phosphopantothenoylcysteine decarboxylase/phosphopantothenate--cysteine ligase CoaBC [bacterium]MBU1653103.1 bifunctional phosphopantothenoylcysteine decarboxylase/phosphopantothenate--cysteine ligase CoaBC [bacterium]MBU1881340.1 bifunctional phosphopantothenoylcysteine decarboxylase/phosphopantothenate--cysteine ligase CoaBC [bacterium]
MLKNRKILLVVTGGIAAYKACELLRLMMKNHASVQVTLSAAAARFVTPLTFEAISGKRVEMGLFDVSDAVGGHLGIVRDIDLMVCAPATANCIAKLSHGIADDLISTAALACTAPILICPAMNHKMWQNAIVQDNVARLKDKGFLVMDPAEGPMASPDEGEGVGRLPEPTEILHRICELLPPKGPLRGKTITVTAGPTQEPIDPVRVISNLSSGRMGFTIAEEARKRGARVHLISGPVRLFDPPGITSRCVNSTQEMLDAVKSAFSESDALIMAAAPGDFRRADPSASKLKKSASGGNLTIELEPTPDILKSVSRDKKNKRIIGFALETDAGLENARRKLTEKGLDLIVLNHPSTGLGQHSIQGTILDATDDMQVLENMPKHDFAGKLLDRLEALLAGK